MEFAEAPQCNNEISFDQETSGGTLNNVISKVPVRDAWFIARINIVFGSENLRV